MHLPANDTSGSELSPREIEILITIERTGAGFSMVAITLTLLSFLLFKKLRTTPNIFIILAFMQSDPWWSFAMAFNVFLVFFNNANPAAFRKRIWIYCIVCFGGPLVPAIVLVSIHDDAKGPVFGNASLWCWIDSNWSLVRLYAYYIPIWICIFGSILIYIAVGYHVFHQRNRLRNFAMPMRKTRANYRAASEAGDSAEESLTRRLDHYGTAVTEVQITSNTPENDYLGLPAIPPSVYAHGPTVVAGGRSWAAARADGYYSPKAKSKRAPIKGANIFLNRAKQPFAVFTRLRDAKSNAASKLKRLDPVKMAYLRTSFIFGFAILITWIPSSVNRLYSLTYHGRVNFQLSIASGCVLPLQGSTVCEELKAFKAKGWSKGRRDYRHTTQLDGRLDAVTYHDRNTLELPTAARVKASRAFDIDDMELSEHFRRSCSI
ncbi:cyclic amp receptor a [Trichoderma cornu-damae]|uniref:Cyclic amp receptor a n=1 Tax=Trichoderma cornu-damae TaxID=654480 RepID=A0A9P8TX83_9HYPO|nr:cyclic amp receptor a [Trichoderma cornu-damae]